MNIIKKIKQANELVNNGNLAEAEKRFKQILTLSKEEFFSLFSLGVIAFKQDNLSLALEYFDRGAKVNPRFERLWFNRGLVLYSLKRHEEAMASYDAALALNPEYIDALNNKGIVQQEILRYTDAVNTYDRLLAIRPDSPKALSNKGYILNVLGRYYEAMECFNRLLEVDPDFDFAHGQLSSVMQYGCIWDGFDRLSEIIREEVTAGKVACKSLVLMAISDSPAEHQQCAKIYAEHYIPPVPVTLWQGERYHHGKIRIAYVSPDLREHPVAHLLAGILEHHDRSRYETFGFFIGMANDSGMYHRMTRAFDHFLDVWQKSSREIAEMIRSCEIDIVIDLAGYTQDSRTAIFSYRPAPVQVNYLGYPGTLGVNYMDYILADSVVIPTVDQEFYHEKVVHLPGAYLPADATLKVADFTPPRESFGLPATGFVFCSFNHAYKINPTIFDAWMKILKRCPGSVLWLMKLNAIAEPNLRKEAEARGVDPARLIFATRVPNVEDHLARYRLADLFLDTTPYNAHTTACDALFVGLPVLTCLGRAFPGRVAASLLRAIGLTELISTSLTDYEDAAVRLAHDPTLLASLKEKLRANRETYPLFKSEEFCRNLEHAYTVMWERTERGEPHTGFQVVRG